MDIVPLGAALAPVRDALLAAARRDAEDLLRQAESAAARTIAEAEAEATRIRAEAAARGAADATAAQGAERARLGRRTRAIVLRAEREEYDAQRAAARAAVAELREDPDYPRIRLRMVDIVRNRLGREAALHDGDGGGVIGEAPGRRLDLSLAAFADRAVDAVLAEATAEKGRRP